MNDHYWINEIHRTHWRLSHIGQAMRLLSAHDRFRTHQRQRNQLWFLSKSLYMLSAHLRCGLLPVFGGNRYDASREAIEATLSRVAIRDTQLFGVRVSRSHKGDRCAAAWAEITRRDPFVEASLEAAVTAFRAISTKDILATPGVELRMLERVAYCAKGVLNRFLRNNRPFSARANSPHERMYCLLHVRNFAQCCLAHHLSSTRSDPDSAWTAAMRQIEENHTELAHCILGGDPEELAFYLTLACGPTRASASWPTSPAVCALRELEQGPREKAVPKVLTDLVIEYGALDFDLGSSLDRLEQHFSV